MSNLSTFQSKANVPSVLKYLAGCKYFRPNGRWVLTSGTTAKCLKSIWNLKIAVWVSNISLNDCPGIHFREAWPEAPPNLIYLSFGSTVDCHIDHIFRCCKSMCNWHCWNWKENGSAIFSVCAMCGKNWCRGLPWKSVIWAWKNPQCTWKHREFREIIFSKFLYISTSF